MRERRLAWRNVVFFYLDKPECVGAGKWVVAGGTAIDRPPPDLGREPRENVRQPRHAPRQRREHLLGSRVGVCAPEIAQGLGLIARDPHAAERADRNAARIGHLLEQDDAGARVVGGDGGGRSGEAAADDDAIRDLFDRHAGPSASASGNSALSDPINSRAISSRMALPFSAVACLGSPRTPVAL